jgi:hypothetical protein
MTEYFNHPGTTPPSATDYGGAFANLFNLTEDITIDNVYWYCDSLVSYASAVKIWNITDNVEVATHATTIPIATGWQTVAITPVLLSHLKQYECGVSSNRFVGWFTAPPAVNAPFTHIGVRYQNSWPANTVSGYELLGVSFGDLEAWLSDDPDLNKRHDDSAPYKTQALAAGGSGFAAIKSVADTIATNVGTLLTRWSAALATTVQTTSDNVATLLSRWSAALATSLQTMRDNFATFFNTIGGTAGGPTGALSGRTAFPTELWTLIDETDFTFQISWDVPADLYTISMSGIPARINTVDVDGATWRPRVGWWAVRNGDLLGARSFLSWENEYVEDGGRRMPGIVIRTHPEITGHVQAWRLT